MARDWYCTLGCTEAKDCRYGQPRDGCCYEYDAHRYPENLRWNGEGDPPSRWRASNGTVVYRTFSDYCD